MRRCTEIGINYANFCHRLLYFIMAKEKIGFVI